MCNYLKRGISKEISNSTTKMALHFFGSKSELGLKVFSTDHARLNIFNNLIRDIYNSLDKDVSEILARNSS